MSKKQKIEEIKNVGEFYQALRNEVANLFNGYDRCGIFEGWTEKQKKECFGFGTHILSNVWLPIQKHYTKKERKRYYKMIDTYEDWCKEKDQRIAELEKALELAKKYSYLLENEYYGNIPILDYFKAKAKEEMKNEKRRKVYSKA